MKKIKEQELIQSSNQKNLFKKLLGKDKIVNSQLKLAKNIQQQQNYKAKLYQYYHQEEGGLLEAENNEQTLKFRMPQLKNELPIKTLNNIFNLHLEFGNYFISYSRNGRKLVLASNKGHVSLIDWQNKNVKIEINVKDLINQVKFLNNEKTFAVAQKKYVFIYDDQGIEIHRLKQHLYPSFIDYLPYHYLLTSIGKQGFLKYQDISTGQIVAEYRTEIRYPTCFKQNPYNAIMCVSDNRGCISMFSPNQQEILVKMICHKGQINTFAIHQNGLYLATIGGEGCIKVWDLRMYKELSKKIINCQVYACDTSQQGLLGIGIKNQIQIFKNWESQNFPLPYMKQETLDNKQIIDIKFTPFEDFCGLGLSNGFQSILVPGASHAEFDTFEVNLYSNKKQTQEKLVKELLDKIPYTTIQIDTKYIGSIDQAAKEVIEQQEKIEQREKEERQAMKKKKKEKTRGISDIKKAKKAEFTTSEAQREIIGQRINEYLKMKRAEKLKAKKDLTIMENLDQLEDSLNPIKYFAKQEVQKKKIQKF